MSTSPQKLALVVVVALVALVVRANQEAPSGVPVSASSVGAHALLLDGSNTTSADSATASGGDAWKLDTVNAFAAGTLLSIEEQDAVRFSVDHDGRLTARGGQGTTFFDMGTSGTSYLSVVSAAPTVRTVTGGGFGANASQAGLNVYFGANANASGEIAATIGTLDTGTSSTLACFARDVDGTPVNVLCFDADGTVDDGALTSGVAFDVDVVPSATNTLSLGGAALDFANAYVRSIQAGGAGTLSLVDRVSVTGDVDPVASSTHTLGDATLEWLSGHIQTVVTSTIEDDDDATVLFNDAFFNPTTDATAVDTGSALGGAANEWAAVQAIGWAAGQTYVAAAPAAFPTCDSGTEGLAVYFDDTNDAFPGGHCFCGQSAANAFAWRYVSDRLTACP